MCLFDKWYVLADIFEYFAEFPVEIERVGTIGVRVS